MRAGRVRLRQAHLRRGAAGGIERAVDVDPPVPAAAAGSSGGGTVEREIGDRRGKRRSVHDGGAVGRRDERDPRLEGAELIRPDASAGGGMDDIAARLDGDRIDQRRR